MIDIACLCEEGPVKEKGIVYGYWGDLKVQFIDLPKYQCGNCNEFYLDEKIAVLTQEITRALDDLGKKVEVVDIRDCYDDLINYVNDIYERITSGQIYLIEIGKKIIINPKDIKSLSCNSAALIAARNNYSVTDDVKREIDDILKGNK